MCLALYIGSSHEIPTTAPWSSDAAIFHVVLSPNLPAAVQHQLDLPYIYYVGSHQGCGCGFHYESIADVQSIGLPADVLESALTDRQRSVDDIRALREYLAKATAAEPLRLLVTWMDDEEVPPKQIRRVTAAFFGGDSWRFEDHEMFEVLPESTAAITPAKPQS